MGNQTKYFYITLECKVPVTVQMTKFNAIFYIIPHFTFRGAQTVAATDILALYYS